MRLEYDWNTIGIRIGKEGEKHAAAQKNQISHSVCSIDGRHSRAVALQYRDRNGEDPVDRNTDYGKNPRRHECEDSVGDPSSQDTGGGDPGRSVGTCRVSASDLFPQPHSRTFRLRNFFRSEDGSGTGDGIFAGEYGPCQLRTVDPGGIFRSYVVHGIRTSHGEKGRQHVHAGGQRRDDRLHLFCHYGTGGDFCGGRGYRESPQLVERKLFRNDLGQCESDEYRGGSDFTYGDPVSKAAGSLPAG